MEKVDLSSLTTEQLEAELVKKKKAEKQAQEKERKQYEAERDIAVTHLMQEALEVQKRLMSLKELSIVVMTDQKEKLEKYGGINKKSKGGFTVKHGNGTHSITRTRSTQPSWDERSSKAVELIKDFLQDTIKKRDLKTYEVLIGFVQKNNNGDLEYSRVMDLLSHQDKWDDPRWVKGLNLIRESYSIHLRGYGYEFKVKDSEGKFQNINLNFSSL